MLGAEEGSDGQGTESSSELGAEGMMRWALRPVGSGEEDSWPAALRRVEGEGMRLFGSPVVEMSAVEPAGEEDNESLVLDARR